MEAAEFLTMVMNGNIIIPEEYRSRFKGSVRVILLAEDQQQSENMIDQLLSNPIQVKNFTPFSREEIYEQT